MLVEAVLHKPFGRIVGLLDEKRISKFD